MNFWKIGFFSTIVILVIGCSEMPSIFKQAPGIKKGVKNYIFLGHIYEGKLTVDQRIQELDYSAYDQIWLGGDICSETTLEEKGVEHVDQLFNLGSETTHWALGNHDSRNGNVHWITDRTKRPTYYTTSFSGITLMVLNTSYYNSDGTYDTAQCALQYEFIEQVLDTVANSSHLIFMTHNAVWGPVKGVDVLKGHANSDYSSFRFQPEKFLRYINGVYPKLVKVQKRGVQVIHVAGDFGQQQTSYDCKSDDGIIYLGSGITADTPYNKKFPSYGKPDQVLVFHHDVDRKDLTWSFVDLN